MNDIPQGPGWWQAGDGKWYPPQPPPPANTLKIVLIVVGLLILVPCLLAVVSIAAVTLLGKNASSKFSSIGSSISDVRVTVSARPFSYD
jgi:Flp pilus assembly pilin Flp